MKLSSTFGLLALSFMGVAFAQEQCLLTDTSCQCSSTVPSGMCLRSQGDGTCLLGLCAEGYRCDCFGYEKCSISKCGKHVPIGGTPSETIPFQCKMVPDAGTCIDQVDFMDTVTAATNAAADATTSNDEATFTESAAIRILDELADEKKAINQMLKEVDRVADNIPESVLEDIESEAKAVFDTIMNAGGVVLECMRDAKDVTDRTNNARGRKRRCKRFGKLEGEKKESLKTEQAKKTQDKSKIDALTKEIIGLEDERSKTAKMCGGEARDAKKKKTSTNNRYKNVQRMRDEVRAASSRCMQKAQRALGEARK